MNQEYVRRLRNEEYITVLDARTWRPTNAQNAKFYCVPCNWYITGNVDEHRKHKEHKKKCKHTKDLSAYLSEMFSKISLSNSEVNDREGVVKQLESRCRKSAVLSDITLQLTGSVRGGYATTESDTNIRIETQADVNYAVVFKEILRMLKSYEGTCYGAIAADFTSKFPSISFTAKEVSSVFCLRLTDKRRHFTALLLSAYSSWHRTLKMLMTLFKHWALLTGLCDMRKGGILPQCFPMLVIHYCQQSGLAPIIATDDETEDDVQESLDKRPNDTSQGEKLARIGSQKLELIWILMLKYYSSSFNIRELCVSIITPGDVEKSSKGPKPWKSSKLAIEDPSAPHRNVCTGVCNQILDHIYQSIAEGHKYFTKNRQYIFLTSDLPIYCRICYKSGHLAEVCSDEILPTDSSLPPVTLPHKAILNSLLTQIKDDHDLDELDKQIRQRVMDKAVETIRQGYPDAQLEVYGSLANGFGSFSSDMDICVTVEGKISISAEEECEVIGTIEMLLKQDRAISKVKAIFAKVPIVKFVCSRYRMECDISANRGSAVQNTKMLRRYSEIDERVAILGHCVKEFAKRYEIADAYHHTLSSYAYILMMIFYLQRCDPPLVPILQELYTEEKPTQLIGGVNAWFYNEDNESLKLIWPCFGQNNQDVAELWIGFLEFYSSKFDTKKQVVCIGQKAEVTQFDMFWNTDKIAIRDPFDHSHNLGAGLQRETNTHILRSLMAARQLFGTSIAKIPDGYHSYFSFFFENRNQPTTAFKAAAATARNQPTIAFKAAAATTKSHRK